MYALNVFKILTNIIILSKGGTLLLITSVGFVQSTARNATQTRTVNCAIKATTWRTMLATSAPITATSAQVARCAISVIPLTTNSRATRRTASNVKLGVGSALDMGSVTSVTARRATLVCMDKTAETFMVDAVESTMSTIYILRSYYA